MIRSNIHCHSCFSDGADSLEDMVLAAISKGFVSLGFSEHAYTTYDTDCCIPLDSMPAYLEEAKRLKEKYRDKIELYVGLEVDGLEPVSKEGLDFTIGSFHYLRDVAVDGYFNYTVDYKTEILLAACDRLAGGDMATLVALYFDSLLTFVESYRPDVVGHVDLITKLNGHGGDRFFDESSGWYASLLDRAADRLAATGSIVEVNTGGIARGYRNTPYPSKPLLQRLLERSVPVMINSDAHDAAAMDFWFDEAEALLKQVGYRAVKQLRGGRFVDVEL